MKRADDAETRLAAERASKDWLTLQLASRIATKAGGYGLDHEPPKPVDVVPLPSAFIRQPTEIDEAKLEYYKRCAREAGHSEEDAVAKWEAEMRGEALSYSDTDN